MTSLTSLLPEWIQAAGEMDPEMRDLAVGGHCDAFALALINTIQQSFPELNAQPVVISRERVSLEDSSVVLDDNPLSHVLVQVEGFLVDVNGINADEAWEGDWIQPDQDEEEVPCEDLFDYHPMSVEGLVALRQERDLRAPDETLTQRFEAVLVKALATVSATPGQRRNARP